MDSLAMPSIKVRLSERKPRDVQLSQWVREDITNGSVNISEIVRELLYAWYAQRYNGGGLLAGVPVALPQPDDREDPNDQLVQNLMGLKFDENM